MLRGRLGGAAAWGGCRDQGRGVGGIRVQEGEGERDRRRWHGGRRRKGGVNEGPRELQGLG